MRKLFVPNERQKRVSKADIFLLFFIYRYKILAFAKIEVIKKRSDQRELWRQRSQKHQRELFFQKKRKEWYYDS